MAELASPPNNLPFCLICTFSHIYSLCLKINKCNNQLLFLKCKIQMITGINFIVIWIITCQILIMVWLIIDMCSVGNVLIVYNETWCSCGERIFEKERSCFVCEIISWQFMYLRYGFINSSATVKTLQDIWKEIC